MADSGGMSDGATEDDQKSEALAELAEIRSQFTRFMMTYQFGLAEIVTKINILKDEFTHIHRYSPIEHVSSRLKTPASILQKASRRGIPLTIDAIRENILDIAGVRISCSFISDTYRIAEMLSGQADVTVLETKDYIANPKPNGYKSLHLLVEIPVFLSDRVQPVCVELQIRTIAMDFWAALEHKIYYKYEREIPEALLRELTEAAEAASRLDIKMERLHDEIDRIKSAPTTADEVPGFPLPRDLLEMLRHLRTS